MHVQNLGYPLPLQIEGPKTTLSRGFRNLTAILTTYVFGIKHAIQKRQVHCKLQGVCDIVIKMT